MARRIKGPGLSSREAPAFSCARSEATPSGYDRNRYHHVWCLTSRRQGGGGGPRGLPHERLSRTGATAGKDVSFGGWRFPRLHLRWGSRSPQDRTPLYLRKGRRTPGVASIAATRSRRYLSTAGAWPAALGAGGPDPCVRAPPRRWRRCAIGKPPRSGTAATSAWWAPDPRGVYGVKHPAVPAVF